MTTATRTNTRRDSKKVYEPVALARVYDKSGACLGYRAPSSDPKKDWYRITCDDNGLWHCNCEAGQHNQLCCHVRAVKEQCKARHELGLPGCKEPTPGTSNDSYSLPVQVAQVIEGVMAANDETPEELMDEDTRNEHWTAQELARPSVRRSSSMSVSERICELAPLHNSRRFSILK